MVEDDVVVADPIRMRVVDVTPQRKTVSDGGQRRPRRTPQPAPDIMPAAI